MYMHIVTNKRFILASGTASGSHQQDSLKIVPINSNIQVICRYMYTYMYMYNVYAQEVLMCVVHFKKTCTCTSNFLIERFGKNSRKQQKATIKVHVQVGSSCIKETNKTYSLWHHHLLLKKRKRSKSL